MVTSTRSIKPIKCDEVK